MQVVSVVIGNVYVIAPHWFLLLDLPPRWPGLLCSWMLALRLRALLVLSLMALSDLLAPLPLRSLGVLSRPALLVLLFRPRSALTLLPVLR